jgi:starvation-inducible DNA-binding protein
MTRQKAQRFGDLKPMKVALSENIRKASVIDLNRALADSIVLRDLYKKHHWQVSARRSATYICCSTSTTRSRTS